MIQTKGYAAQDAKSPLAAWNFQRREVEIHDVQIDILYCGVCHSDLHQIRNEWGGSIFPMVPGHEIIGRISKVGSKVKKFKVGDLAGVGCLVDSCRECDNCQHGLEQYCTGGPSFTYNSLEQDRKTITYGGYSKMVVVNEDFVLHVPEKLPIKGVAPLLCAGITTYSPLRHWKVGKGHKIGILGLGGLGHMAVKFAASFGAEVTMLSTSPSKEADAKKLGAHKFLLTTNKANVESVKGYFDFILDTVSAPHDYNLYLSLIKDRWHSYLCRSASNSGSNPWIQSSCGKKKPRRFINWGLTGNPGNAGLLCRTQHYFGCRNNQYKRYKQRLRTNAERRCSLSFCN